MSESRWRSPTNKPVWTNYSTDQKYFTGHMHLFNIKLEEKSYLFIYLHFIYSWQSLVIYYNRFFFQKKTNI